jgi:hypothetical protein
MGENVGLRFVVVTDITGMEAKVEKIPVGPPSCSETGMEAERAVVVVATGMETDDGNSWGTGP